MIYGAIWKKLPGGKFLKSLQSAILLLAAVAALFGLVFPWVELSFFAPPLVGE